MLNKKEISQKYIEGYREYLRVVSSFAHSKIYENTLEASYESLNDWSLFHRLDEVKKWFIEKREHARMKVTDIPLNEVRDWCIDPETGNIFHESHDFFIIHGLRVETLDRERSSGWDQPILEQVGYDGGLLGMIRKRFHGVPHYLCEAKMEPGNYGKVQLSPTLQATFSNLKKAHKGRKPFFSDYFENTDKHDNIKVLFDAWLAEDGGRLHLKRNRAILIEVSEDLHVDLPTDHFIWLSLYQIKELLKEDAWINPHIRGIMAHV